MSNRPIMYLNNPDSLSIIFSKLQLSAEVYVNGDFCGTWAVDTSGSRRIPFHLIGRGKAWLHMDGNESIGLSSGDLVVFPKDHQHILANSSEVPAASIINNYQASDSGAITNLVCGFFEFKNKAAWPLLDSLPPLILLDLSEISTNAFARNLIDMIIAELNQAQPGYYAAINHLAELLFIQVIRTQILSGKIKSGLLCALFDKQIGKALSAIHQSPEKRWTLERLAETATMGRSGFAKRFNDLVGQPAMQYLAAWRMQEATSLLLNTTESILAIADKCGYESEAAFRKAYKNNTGSTPGEVRKNMGATAQ